MSRYIGYSTPAEFDAGYDNFITPEVVAHWDGFFERRARTRWRRWSIASCVMGRASGMRSTFFPRSRCGDGAAAGGNSWRSLVSLRQVVHAFPGSGVHARGGACGVRELWAGAGTELVADRGRLPGGGGVFAAEAEGLGVDAGRVSVLGHSAAGQLAALVASDYRA